MAIRHAVVWCADWPVIAAGYCPQIAVAFTTKQRVSACSVAARQHGVRVGNTAAQARALCPDISLEPADIAHAAAQFATVAAHCANVTPFLHIIAPGVLLVSSALLPNTADDTSPLLDALFGALDAAAETLLSCHTHNDFFRVGIADTVFAALIAASRTPTAMPCTCVPSGSTESFLSQQTIDVLQLLTYVASDPPESGAMQQLIDDCRTVGITTCQDFTALDKTVLMDRFGLPAHTAYNVITGNDNRFPTDLYTHEKRRFTQHFTPALNDTHAVSFAARRLFDSALRTVRDDGKACDQVRLDITTENDEKQAMTWQARETFTAPMLQDRLRWQLDGWSQSVTPPTAGIVELCVTLERTVPAARQTTILADGTDLVRHTAVEQAASRIDGLVGEGTLLQPYRSFGRHPAQWAKTQPFSSATPATHAATRWTNQLPPPAPATLYQPPRPAQVTDVYGEPVTVTHRGALTRVPYLLHIRGSEPEQIASFAGPWLSNERWWERAPGRAARFQMVTAGGHAYLVAQQLGTWCVEAFYD